MQFVTLTEDPVQGAPPREGTGLSHTLVAHKQPSPVSDISQEAQVDQADQPPSTVKEKYETYKRHDSCNYTKFTNVYIIQ